MGDYQIANATGTAVTRKSDGTCIPFDLRNIDYQNYLVWAATNTPDAYVAPVVPLTLTFLQFMALFSPAEQAAIVNSSDTQVKLFLLMATGTGTIDMTNAELIAGVNYLASGPALITSGRVPQILAGQIPS